MIKKLVDIADIQFGVYDKPQAQGKIKYLLGKHFDENGLLLDAITDSFIASDSKNAQHLLQAGDVLLAGKGFKIFAWQYTPKMGDAVATSLFYIIKPNPTIILPEYLTIVLNSAQVQHQIQIFGSGTSIFSIRKKELVELEIPVPPLEVQSKIAKMGALLQKEMQMTQQILQKKKAIFDAAISKTINQ
jgi:restriction endonuclease S subunit